MADDITPDRPDAGHPETDRPATKPIPVKPQNEPLSDRDEAAPGTPGTGEAIDPQTGETYIKGIGGA